jgi:predicted Fe-Mo cluster-binding NifX family protein
MDSEVDPRFGRARQFAVVDTATGEIEVIDNAQGVGAVQGAGVHAAETASRLGADCLITGHCGPKAFRALQAAGVAVFTGAAGTVREALQQLEAGRLERAAGPDVMGHWT